MKRERPGPSATRRYSLLAGFVLGALAGTVPGPLEAAEPTAYFFRTVGDLATACERFDRTPTAFPVSECPRDLRRVHAALWKRDEHADACAARAPRETESSRELEGWLMSGFTDWSRGTGVDRVATIEAALSGLSRDGFGCERLVEPSLDTLVERRVAYMEYVEAKRPPDVPTLIDQTLAAVREAAAEGALLGGEPDWNRVTAILREHGPALDTALDADWQLRFRLGLRDANPKALWERGHESTVTARQFIDELAVQAGIELVLEWMAANRTLFAEAVTHAN